MHILFYVSGHGFGHARRTSAILKALRVEYPDVAISIRTTAPATNFTRIGIPPESITPSSLDTGVVERDILTIDGPRTVERLIALLRNREQIISDEVVAVKNLGITAIAADIPFLAGEIAMRIGVPCAGMSNFTWDWICEPFFTNVPGGAETLAEIAADYGKMTEIIRQPFSHPMPQFKKVTDVPIVAHRSQMQKAEVRQRLGLDRQDSRPLVLLGMRGGMSDAALEAGVRSAPDFLFTTTQAVPSGMPSNLHPIDVGRLDFSDLLTAHDVVISKVGYGVVCESIAAKTRLLWPRRTGFREDQMFEQQAPAFLTMQEIAAEDYLAGRWADGLRQIIRQPFAGSVPQMDGAEQTSRELMNLVR